MANLRYSTYPAGRLAHFSNRFYIRRMNIFAECATISNYGVDYIQLTDSGFKNSHREISFVGRNVLYTMYV